MSKASIACSILSPKHFQSLMPLYFFNHNISTHNSMFSHFQKFFPITFLNTAPTHLTINVHTLVYTTATDIDRFRNFDRFRNYDSETMPTDSETKIGRFRNFGRPIQKLRFRNFGRPIQKLRSTDSETKIDRFINFGRPIQKLRFRNFGRPIQKLRFRNFGRPIQKLRFRNYDRPIQKLRSTDSETLVDRFRNYDSETNRPIQKLRSVKEPCWWRHCSSDDTWTRQTPKSGRSPIPAIQGHKADWAHSVNKALADKSRCKAPYELRPFERISLKDDVDPDV